MATGTGTQTDPYIVSTLADLRTAAGTAGAYVEMDPDASTKILDLNGSATNPVTQRLDINCASLAGNGWRIRNLYFSSPSDHFLVSTTTAVTQVSDLHFDNLVCNNGAKSLLSMANTTLTGCSFTGLKYFAAEAYLLAAGSSTHSMTCKSCTFAMQAQGSGIPYGIGFIKNKYIGRTFIQGSQKQRENSVRIKLNVVTSTVKGKRVVLVDDSIVRGTTSARIIKLLRDAGAKEVHFRVSAPPFKYPCYFGTDIPDQKLLVATGRTVDQINEIIGADTLGYLSTEHVVQLAQNANCGFCTACFTGKYAVKPEEVLSTDIHERHLNDRPKDEKKLGE